MLIASCARGLLAVLLGLAFWGAAPALLGWQPTTVMTGSMAPRLKPGDVVVSRPMPATVLRIGQVLLVHSPDDPGSLRLHRYVANASGGALVTKGDANANRDSTPVARSAVVGVGFLRIPLIGLPLLWIHDHDWPPLVLFGALLAGLGLLSGIDGTIRHPAPGPGSPPGAAPGAGPGSGEPDASVESGDDLVRAGPASAPLSATSKSMSMSERAYRAALRDAVDVHPALSVSRGRGHGRSRREVARLTLEVRRLRLLSIVAVALLVAGGATFESAGRADAAVWTATTSNPASSFVATTAVAPTGLTCTNATSSTVTISWTYSGVAAAQFDVLNTTAGNSVVVSTAGTVMSATFGTASLLALGTANVAVRTDLTTAAPAWQSPPSATIGVKVLSLIGLGAVQCA